MDSSSSVRVIRRVGGVDGTVSFEAVDAGGAPAPGARVAIVARTHGNEPVGDAALERLAALAEAELVSGSVLAVRANAEAAKLDLRHTPGGVDLNRLWDRTTLQLLAARDPETLCYEQRRALELAPLLTACDALIDLHSTSRPSTPFLLFRDDQRHAAIATRLGVGNLITGMHENAIVSGGLCSNVGLEPGEPSARLGFTFEAGQHSAPGNGERAWLVVVRLLHAMGVWRTAPPPAPPPLEVYEVLERFLQAPRGAEPYRFVGYEGGPPGSGRRGPSRLLHSFEEIQADEVVVASGRDHLVRAQSPFTMLMPAPDTEPGTDLFFVSLPRHGGLAMGDSRTDAEARREALAIERMLDLVDDDDIVRGATWVSFDPRQVLDRCADIIGRTQRLPPGHPHRRITVVGRGDVAEEPAERRAGQRYRQAMRGAVAGGIPVTRVQLLRGAHLAWLDALTAGGMIDLLRRREADHGVGVGGVRLQISVQQPHTVSLLVAGDLERAIQLGDTRGVRVAVLVEAATVEAEGAVPRVRVLRLGLISARPEILSAARGLLEALRGEHRYQVTHAGLSQDPRIRPLLLPDGDLEARPDPQALAGLRGALYRLQLRLWCDQLLHEGLAERHLEAGPELGRWLAATMSATGILDAEAVRALALERDGSGWRVVPERVRALSEQLARPDTGAAVRVDVGRPVADRPLPPQPLGAAELRADDLERWFGWKRWVRGAQTLPGTRGKDLDLVTVDTEVRDRLVRWYAHARAVAAARPGGALVVVAGDGSNPRRDDLELLRAHRALVSDPNLHYLRIQHGSGTHLGWMKGFAEAVAARPVGPGSLALRWEGEHGATVSVVLFATRHEDAGEIAPWTLEGWSIERCAIILSDLQHGPRRDYKVGLATEGAARGDTGSGNAELLHFGRRHCENLLQQAGPRARGDHPGDVARQIEAVVLDQIGRWISRARSWRRISSTVPHDARARAIWIARRLGVSDPRLAEALVAEMEGDGGIAEAAAGLWKTVDPWPGRAWEPPRELG